MINNAIAFIISLSIIILVNGFVYEKSIKDEIRYLVGIIIVASGFAYKAIAKIIKKREAARKEEAPPVIKVTTVLVQDTEKIDSLTAEVNSLKTSLLSERKIAEEAKQDFAIAQAKNEELMKKFEEVEHRVKELQDSVQRFGEKLSYVESENGVLFQQALTISPTSKSLDTWQPTTIIRRTPENGIALHREPRTPPPINISFVASNSGEPETEEKTQKSLNEKQQLVAFEVQESQDLLIKCIAQDLGFSGSIPFAACVIYKSLLQWRLFEVERTTVFDHIIQTIGSASEVQDNNDALSYWLSNSSTILLLLQHRLKASGAASMTPQRRRATSASLFGRMSQGLQASPQSPEFSFLNGHLLGELDDFPQVEAKYPALLFKQLLTALLEKHYSTIRDNLKKEITPLLGLCIQAPKTFSGSLVKGSCSQAHWQSIVKKLDKYLKTLKANFVPPFLVCKVFTQIFSFINVQLFNSLLLRRECCLFSSGEYVKAGLAEFEQWCIEATEDYTRLAWEELKHIRQAVAYLVMHQKSNRTLNEITKELCPVLSIQQLYRISTMYGDDKYSTGRFSLDVNINELVISSMRVLMTEDSSDDISSSFLLDDDSSIPFSVDDISKSME